MMPSIKDLVAEEERRITQDKERKLELHVRDQEEYKLHRSLEKYHKKVGKTRDEGDMGTQKYATPRRRSPVRRKPLNIEYIVGKSEENVHPIVEKVKKYLEDGDTYHMDHLVRLGHATRLSDGCYVVTVRPPRK